MRIADGVDKAQARTQVHKGVVDFPQKGSYFLFPWFTYPGVLMSYHR